MDTEALEEARKEREKEVKMYSVLQEILAYFFFLWVIMILSYGNRDPNNFYLREALVKGFIKPGDLYNEYNKVKWTLCYIKVSTKSAIQRNYRIIRRFEVRELSGEK